MIITHTTSKFLHSFTKLDDNLYKITTIFRRGAGKDWRDARNAHSRMISKNFTDGRVVKQGKSIEGAGVTTIILNKTL